MSNTELVPERSEELRQLNQKLATLTTRATDLQVRDQTGCIEAKTLKLDLAAYVKAVRYQTGPEIEIKKEELRNLQSQEKMLLSPAETALDVVNRRLKDWENEERRKAEEEQRRINEENRIKAQQQADAERKEREKQAEIDRKAREKEIEQQRKSGEIKAREAERLKKEAAEAAQRERDRAAADAQKVVENAQQVTVKPNIPAVAGTVSRVNWKFRMVNPKAIPAKYLVPDDVAIGQMVRKTQDKEKAQAECPGIEVYQD